MSVYYPPSLRPPGYVSSIRAISPTGSTVLTIGGSLISFANVIASASVCYTSLIHQRTDRIPHLCTALVELVLGALTMTSLVYSMMHDVLLPHVPCVVVGFLTHLTVSIDIVVALCLSILTWLRLSDSYRSKTGTNNWKLWVLVLSIPVILCCVTVGLNGFGEDFYWCHVQPTTTGATIGLATLIAINYLTLALVTYFYLSSISRQHQVSNLSYTVGMGTMGARGQRRQSMVEPINILTPHAPSAAMGLYPPASSIGFELNSAVLGVTTVAPLQRPKSNLTIMSGSQAWWVYFLFIAGFHIGGIAKAVLFHKGKEHRLAESRATRAMERRSVTHPTTLSMGVNNPEFRRPAPSWLGQGNTLTDMWMSNSTLATTSSPLQTSSTDDRVHQPPTVRHVHTEHQTPNPTMPNNPASMRKSLYPDTAPYVFRQATASFGTNSDSSGPSPTASILASRRNVDMTPLSLDQSSKDTINSRVPESTPEELSDDSDHDGRIKSMRAERVSLHHNTK